MMQNGVAKDYINRLEVTFLLNAKSLYYLRIYYSFNNFVEFYSY